MRRDVGGACVECNELVGRDGELRTLAETLSPARRGRGVVVSVTGPIACGKTELLDAAAAAHDAITVRALCSSAEQSSPYAVIGQLLEHPELARRAVGLARQGVPARRLSPEAENGLRGDLTRTVLALAAERPVLIGVDDVHHADSASLDCLLHLARRAGTARIALVLTELRRRTPVHSRFQAELLSLRHHHGIELRPLSAEHTADLARAVLGTEVAEAALTEVYRATGGNPNLSRGLLDDVRAAWAAGGTGIHAGRAYRLAYLGSLYRCGPIPVRVARVTALLGPNASAALVRRISGLNAATADEATEVLTEGGLLRGHRFPHPAARSVVLDDMTAQERRRLHSRALEVLDDVPVDVLAHHWAGAGRTRGPKAAELFAAAGRELHMRGELDAAADYLEMAYRASGDAATRAALRVEALVIERRRNPLGSGRPLDFSRPLGELGAAARAGQLSPEHATMMIRWFAIGGRPGEAAELLASRRRHAITVRDRAHLRTAELSFALLCPNASGSGRRPDPLTADELASLPEAARLAARADNAVLAALDGRPGTATAQAESVLRDAAPAAGATVLAALRALLYAENADAAQFWAEKLAADAAAGERSSYAVPRAEAALRRGDLAAAAEFGRQALADRRPSSLNVAAALPLSSAVAAAVRLGEVEQARRLLAEPLPEATRDSLFGLHALWARGQFCLATGRDQAAYTAFRTCGERMLRWGVDVPGVALWRVDAAEALLHSSDRETGRRLLDEQLTCAMGPRSRGLTLRVRAAYDAPAKRVGLLEEAAELLSSGDQYERARVLADLRDACEARGQHRRARELRKQARQLAVTCGATPLLRRLGTEPVRPGRLVEIGLPQRIRSLTEAERRVASLAAAGRTNREIAGRLHITASTVEQHLTNVFRKLGVDGRRHLPPELADAA